MPASSACLHDPLAQHQDSGYMGIHMSGKGRYPGGQLYSYVAAAAALQEGVHIGPSLCLQL